MWFKTDSRGGGYLEQTKFLDWLSEDIFLLPSYLQLIAVSHIDLKRYTVIVSTAENKIFNG
jgi:hypothetical protein